MKDVQKEINRLRTALELIAHATAPSHEDGGAHENAYVLATEALAFESNSVLDSLQSRLNALDNASDTPQTPSWYRREVHEGWPEWSDSDSFSDGEGGGEPYYSAPATPGGSLIAIRELYEVLRSIEVKHGAVWNLYKPDNYQRMMQQAEYWLSSPKNNANQYVPIEFLKVANRNHEHFEREWHLRGHQLEELKFALEKISAATSPDKEASANFGDIHFTAIEALRVQKSEEDQSHVRDPEGGHSFTSMMDNGGFDDDCFDDICIKQFSQAMREKMAISRSKGRGGWEKPEECSVEKIAQLLVAQLGKGDPVDVGNYAMMLFVRKAIPQVLMEAMESISSDHANQ